MSFEAHLLFRLRLQQRYQHLVIEPATASRPLMPTKAQWRWWFAGAQATGLSTCGGVIAIGTERTFVAFKSGNQLCFMRCFDVPSSRVDSTAASLPRKKPVLRPQHHEKVKWRQVKQGRKCCHRSRAPPLLVTSTLHDLHPLLMRMTVSHEYKKGIRKTGTVQEYRCIHRIKRFAKCEVNTRRGMVTARHVVLPHRK